MVGEWEQEVVGALGSAFIFQVERLAARPMNTWPIGQLVN